MGWYRIVLHCTLSKGLSVDGETMGGFFARRFVEAPFDEAAADLAIEQLRAERKFRTLRTQLSEDPVITVDEIKPTAPPPPGKRQRPSFVFYPVEDDSGDAA